MNKYKNCIDILRNALNKNVSIHESAIELGFTSNYVTSAILQIESAYTNNRISEQLYGEYKSLLDQLGFDTSINVDDDLVSEIEELTKDICELSAQSKKGTDRQVIFSIGARLLRLKDLLSGRYTNYVEENLPFSQRTARSYIKIFFDMGGTYTSEGSVPSKSDVHEFLSDGTNNLDPVMTSILNSHNAKYSDSKEPVDEYDNRSRWSAERDDEGNIINYKYYIYLRDRGPIEGTLSIQQMEEIYRKYPYVTQATVSQDLPFLTFIEFRKVLRCFNITKDRLFPPHILEKYNEQELAEFALKAKESAGLKRMTEQSSKYFEQRFKDAQKDMYQLQEERTWISNVIDQYFNERDNTITAIKYDNIKKSANSEKKARLYCLMSDLHIGKRYDHPLYGRGYNKDIARERFQQMALEVCKEAQNYEHLTVLCGGDLTESIMENGLHNGIHKYMDLFQEHQIFYAIDLFHEFFSTIIENTDLKSIELLGLEGNHDRIGVQRNDDKNRTAAKIIYKILEREWGGKIKVIIANEGVISESRENICLISHHGDSSLAKRKGEELVNLFGRGKDAYHLVIQGHYHHLSCKEGTNFVMITLPSVCSADTYAITEFAQNAQPGFIMGHQADNGLGFDFKKVTLY